MRKLLLFLVLVLGISSVYGITSDVQLEETTLGHSKLFYVDDAHAVWTRSVQGQGMYILDYLFENNTKNVIGGGDGEYVGMTQESDIYVSGQYICWTEGDGRSDLTTIGYAKSGSETKGICTKYAAKRFSVSVDKLGNVFWAEQTGDPNTWGIYVFNIETGTQPRRIFSYPLGEFSSRVYACNGYAVWYYPNKTGKMDLYAYWPDGSIENITQTDEKTIGSPPVFFGETIYWMSGTNLIKFDVVTKFKEIAYSFDYTNMRSLSFANNPDNDMVVMQGMRMTGSGENSVRHHFIFTYDPSKKIGKEFQIENTLNLFIGSNSSQGKKIVFECSEPGGYQNTCIKLYNAENDTIETLINNTNRSCTFREVPRIKGNRVGWSEVNMDADKNKESSVYFLDISF